MPFPISKQEIVALLQKRLDSYRLHHSLCVAEAAKRLAEKYGGDPMLAEYAGLLHDICKNDPDCTQLQTIRKGGIMLTETELVSPPLYHAIAGAAYIKGELGINDPTLLNAVRYHTTGRAGMTKLEQIIFVADFISADRSYPDVETVRLLADQGLEQAILYALEYTICDLIKRKKYLHPDSVAAYNEMRKIMEGSNCQR